MTLSTGSEGKKTGLAWKHLELLVLLSHLDNAWLKKNKIIFTYNRHTAQWGYERCWSKAIGSKVSQFPNTHENHTAPPHDGCVVGFGSSLCLTYMGVFLSGREGTRARGAKGVVR